MSYNNNINNNLTSPFTIGGTTITPNRPQLEFISTLSTFPFNDAKITVFTASGTFTPDANMVCCKLECIGGGGAGGGSVALASTAAAGGGGGAGEYAFKWCLPSDIGASKAVTIGAGGTGVSAANGNNGAATSVGSLCVANGGNGGLVGNVSTSILAVGSTGGTGGTGDFTCPGGRGWDGAGSFSSSNTYAIFSGRGGNSYVSPGANAAVSGGTSLTGTAGTLGSGGSGSTSNGTTSSTGGAGGPGYVIVTEFLSH